VADWDNTEDRERDEDAAWRDLVAQFDTPSSAQQPVPWPEREDMPQARGPRVPHEAHETEGTRGVYRSDGILGAEGEPALREPDGGRRDEGLRGPDGVYGESGPDGLYGERGPDGLYGELETGGSYRGFGEPGADGARDGFGGGRLPGAHDPDLTLVPRLIRGPAAGGTPARGTPTDDEHFVPPAPPPLPRLDPLTKGAWAALFGGPGYLVVATAAGWSVPGLAAFCAVAAFVAGFAILVLRMNEPGPGGPDDGDDGAVV
jgi:hypothetical protein